MSLSEELNELETARKNVGGKLCRIAEILSELTPKDAAALERLLDHTQVYGTQIAEALTRNGHKVTGSNVQHHRRRVKGGGCSCPPPKPTAS